MVREASADEAGASIRSGDTVFIDTSRPSAVARAVAAGDDRHGVSVFAYGYPYDDQSPLPRLADAGGIDVRVSMAFGEVRAAVEAGTVEYVPQPLYATSADPYPDTDGRTVAIVTAPAVDGPAVTLSALSTFGASLAEQADILVVERNPAHPPATDHHVDRAAVDYVVDASGDPPTMRMGEDVTSAERRVAENVRDVLPADPTLQLGVGSVATALGEELAGGPDLDLWTGLLGSGARAVVDGGSVGSVTGCVAVGPHGGFYDWLRAQSGLSLRPASTVHNTAEITDVDRFTAVNSALQVDLTGQVNAESIGGRRLSGVGGQLDFMYAARADPDGLAVVASTARSPGGHSRIVSGVASTDVVTTPRHLVDAVVTEYGVADLRHRAVDERAAALIEVAHPDDRPQLRAAVEESR